MRKQFWTVLLIIVSCISASAQKPGVTPPPTTRIEVQKAIQREQDAQRQREYERARPIIPNGPARGTSITAAMRRHRLLLEEIYRNPTDEELATIAPSSEDTDRFAEFLRQPNTGLFKLVSDKGCFSDSKIVVIKPECQQYTVPGAGSAYSFRVNTYRVPSVADLVYKENKFTGGETLTQEIFVEIGDVPLDTVNLKTAGMKFLIDFNAKTDANKLKETAAQLASGIEKDGFQYRSALNVNADSTYLLRSIAYEGTLLRTFDGRIFYNEVDWDKRKDVIVAFRVVRKDADKNITILWKELAKKDAPKIK